MKDIPNEPLAAIGRGVPANEDCRPCRQEATPARARQPGAVPLAVDLDGTLIRSDLLIETAFAELGRGPWRSSICSAR